MKRYLILILILVQVNCVVKKDDLSTEFECIISAPRKIYKLGELPEIKVSIVNKSGKDVYLIENLDGSEEKWRMPYCYYVIEKPEIDSIEPVFRCGNMNALNKKNFKLVKQGGEFNPYRQVSGYDKAFEMTRLENFRNAGKYKITFIYSTKSNNLEDFIGDGIYGNHGKEVSELFKLVPSIELRSNSLEIEIHSGK